jgi:hypothetical protein
MDKMHNQERQTNETLFNIILYFLIKGDNSNDKLFSTIIIFLFSTEKSRQYFSYLYENLLNRIEP